MDDHLKAIGQWHVLWLREAYRVLRPEGVAKIFSGTRTCHRLGWAMTKVGFQIVGLDAWAYGSGWPKSLDVHHALDGHQEQDLYRGYGTALKSCWEPFLVGKKMVGND